MTFEDEIAGGSSRAMTSNGFRVDYRPAVVVLNMHYTGLGVARALYATGVPLWGLSFDDTFIGNPSRCCRFSLYPDPARDPDASLAFLDEFARRFARPPLLLPTRDLDLQFLLNHRSKIEANYLLPLAPSPVMERILNKRSLAAAAREIGIFCPDEVLVSEPADLARVRGQVRLPCIVKPVAASRWRHGEIHEAVGRRKVVVFDRWEELVTFYERIARLDPEILVQDYIPGGDANLGIFGSYFSVAGQVVRYFTARKILQNPPESGTGIVVRAEPVPDIIEPSIHLLRVLRYSGISEIEYKFDRRTGQYALIEINPRHWDQHTLGLACGVNVTRALYDDLVGERVPEMPQDPRAVSWIAEEGYLVGLRDALRGSGYPLRQYLGALRGRKAWATFDWKDPRPAMRLLRRVLADYARSVRGFTGRLLTRPMARRPR